MSEIPISVIAVAAGALAKYYTHTELRNLAERLGLSVNGSDLNKIDKARAYLLAGNMRPNPYDYFGKLIEEFMDKPEMMYASIDEDREGILKVLSDNGLSYLRGGKVEMEGSIEAGGSIQAAGSIKAGVIETQPTPKLYTKRQSPEITMEIQAQKNLAKVFISHASEDEPIIKALGRDLLPALGLNLHNDIFCTTLKGLGIPHGHDWRRDIQDHLRSCKVVILVISEAYKRSEVCLNELGAAWMIDKPMLPLVIPPLKKGSVGVLVDVLQQKMITEESDLDEFEMELRKLLGTPQNNSVWKTGEKNFLNAIGLLLSGNQVVSLQDHAPHVYLDQMFDYNNGVQEIIALSFTNSFGTKITDLKIELLIPKRWNAGDRVYPTREIDGILYDCVEFRNDKPMLRDDTLSWSLPFPAALWKSDQYKRERGHYVIKADDRDPISGSFDVKSLEQRRLNVERFVERKQVLASRVAKAS